MENQKSYQCWELLASLREEYIKYYRQLNELRQCLDITGKRIEDVKLYVKDHVFGSIQPLPDGPTVCLNVIQKRNRFQEIYENVSLSTGIPIPWTDATYALKKQGPNYTVVPESLYSQFRPSVRILDQEKLNDKVEDVLNSSFVTQFGEFSHTFYGDPAKFWFCQTIAKFCFVYSLEGKIKFPLYYEYLPNLDIVRVPSNKKTEPSFQVFYAPVNVEEYYWDLFDRNLENYSSFSIDESCHHLDRGTTDFELIHNTRDKSLVLTKKYNQ